MKVIHEQPKIKHEDTLITHYDLLLIRRDIQDDLHRLELSMIKLLNDNLWRVVGIIGGIQALILGIFGISQYLLK